MSAPDFKTLLDGADDPDVMKAMMIWNMATMRMNPRVMRVVWEALEQAEHFIESSDYSERRFARFHLKNAIALLNATPTDKKEEGEL